jgi:hypothetical protein
MAKNRNLIKNTSYNFKLRSRPSFFIGTYIILGALLIKTAIFGFTTDSSPFSFLTVNFLELFIFIITLICISFSLFALFFGCRRFQRKIGNKVWNKNTKKMMWILFLLIIILYFVEFYLLRIGEEAFIIPTFVISYGILLLALNFSKTIRLYQFSIACFLIGFIPLIIDGFGFNSLIVLGIAQYIYAISQTKKEIKNSAS